MSLLFTANSWGQSVPEGQGYGAAGLDVGGQVNDVIPIVSIGHGGNELAHGINFFGNSFSQPTTASDIEIEAAPTGGKHYYFVSLPGSPSIRFIANTDTPTTSTVFTEYVKTGSSLSYETSEYVFTSKHGTKARFAASGTNALKLTIIEAPDGSRIRYDYVGSELSSIRNSAGYQLKYQLLSTPDRVVAINNAVEYCNPIASQCSPGSQWADGTEGSGQTSVEDAEGRIYGINDTSSSITLSYPQSGAVVSSSYDSSGYTTSSTRFGITTSYSTIEDTKGTLDDGDDIRYVYTTLPGGGTQSTISLMKGGLPTSTTNTLGEVSTYTYTPDNLIDTMTAPRGNIVDYAYDARGNVTEIRRKGISVGGATAADLVTTAYYPSVCTSGNRLYCNKPTWTRDVAGNQTDYTYHAQSGQVATVRGPSDGTNPRPLTRFTYTQLSAQVKTSASATGASDPIWKLSSIERLADTAGEITTSLSYDAQQNLVLSSVTVSGAGMTALTTSYDYDNYGNQTSVDGPISGNSDRITTFYDDLRRAEGQIGADPDATGPMLRPAVKYLRNGVGQVTDQLTGTATGYTLSSFTNMTVHETRRTVYNGVTLQATQVALLDGTTTLSRVEFDYDSSGRVTCSALRMDAALTATGNACQLGSPGIYGFDRITKREYDIASRVTKQTAGFGTAAASEQTYAYYAFGPAEYVTDGNGNQSRFTFDSHNRPWQTFYPKASSAGYNPSDYSQVSYDANGRRSQIRQRDGGTVNFGYDNIGRLNLINAPGSSEDTSSVYDIAGRVTQISKPGSTINFTYDTFGRRKTETSGSLTVGYDYDAYGRRTRMDYPGTDNFYINYDYYTTGRLKTIKERNSIQLAEYTYDSRGRRDELRRGPSSGGVYNNVTRYSYGALSQLSSLENDISGTGTAVDQLLSFTYAPSGQIHTQTNSNTIYDPTPANYDNSFGVNGLNQITD
ncbi:MAG: RHS repeat domain-containing protein [Litorimonas sp.]